MTKTQLLALADAQGKLTTFSKGTNLETENLLSTFTNIGKKTFPDALKSVNDMSQALGQDTKSSAIQLGKALNDPIKGITALSRVGVSFTQQQKDQIKAMVAAKDAAGAQSIILKELQKEFGGSAEAAGKTFNGQLTILKNGLIGMGGSIANVVLPYLTSFLTWVNTNMPAIQAVFIGAINYIVPKFQELSTFVKEKVTPILAAMGDWVTKNMPSIKQFIVDMVDIVVPKFQKIIDIVGQIYNEIFPSMQKTTIDLSDTIKGLTKDALDIAIVAFSWIRDNIPLVKDVVAALTAVWLTQKGVALAHNIALAAHNVQMGIKKGLDIFETAQIWLLIAAEKAHTVAVNAGALATKAVTAAQWLFNAAMEANPIGVTIALLAGLGLAIYEVVKHWQDICTWVEKAWDWLNIWNKTPAVSKAANVTVTTNSAGVASKVGTNAAGTDYWRGGLTSINEAGGEIVDLPTGTRIIPHDVSMEMAKNNEEKKQTIYNFNIDHVILPDVKDGDSFINGLITYSKTH
jgi:hypothetical protein